MKLSLSSSMPNYALYAADLRQQVSIFVRRIRRESPSAGLPIAQLMLLSHVERLGSSVSPSELAEIDGLRPSNLSALLTDLEKNGLITRRQATTDKRRVTVALTRQGKNVLKSNRAERESWLARAMAEHLSPDELELLRKAGALLEKLAYCGENLTSR